MKLNKDVILEKINELDAYLDKMKENFDPGYTNARLQVISARVQYNNFKLNAIKLASEMSGTDEKAEVLRLTK